MPLADYAKIIRDIINPDIELGIWKKEFYPHQPMYLCADITNLARDTGYIPNTDFNAGIRETIDYNKRKLQERSMKTINVLIPTYNEEENVIPLTQAIEEQFENYLSGYDYNITYIDNDSTDTTRQKIQALCEKDTKKSGLFSMQRILGSLIHHFMGCVRWMGTV